MARKDTATGQRRHLMLLYLLGFPTPVIEIIVVLAGTVILLAISYGLRFETVDMDERTADDETETEVTG